MARSVIGLDVGTAAVRAAEVRVARGTTVLERFGQVALPPGAVVAGEVVDVPTVAAAIKRLWKEAGFKGRDVVCAVAGVRVVARTAELPAMSDDDLRSSLAFQVADLIPIPIDEAVLDHQVIAPVVGEDGSERVRVLVVGAHKDLVRSLLAATESAGLSVSRLDLAPLALLRALGSTGFAELSDDSGATAEAIVDIGAGLTNVVVHEHGVPSFIRTTASGGGDVTEALVTDLDVDYEVAEARKRSGGTEVEAEHTKQVVSAALIPLLEEVRSSLDFWQAQESSAELRQIIITGAGSRSTTIAERLESMLGVPVVRGRALEQLDTRPAHLPEDSLEAANDVAAIAVGLGLSAEGLTGGTRRISLLPTELAEARRERRMTLAAGAGVAAFALLLGALYGMRNGQVDDAQQAAAQEEARTTELNQQIAQLQDVEKSQADLAARQATLTTALEGDVAWTRLVREIATVMPNDVWLTSFSGSRGDEVTPGTVSVDAMGFDHTSTAHWLIRLGELPAITGLWVPSSTKTEADSGENIVSFSSSANLTTAAQSDRAARYLGSAE